MSKDLFAPALIKSMFFKKVIHKALLCLTFSFCFLVILISSKSNSEDVFPEDEWLGFLFLGVKEAR